MSLLVPQRNSYSPAQLSLRISAALLSQNLQERKKLSMGFAADSGLMSTHKLSVKSIASPREAQRLAAMFSLSRPGWVPSQEPCQPLP